MVKGFYNRGNVPRNAPKTSLDQLDEMERYLNKGKAVTERIGIEVYELEQGESGETVWYRRRNPPAVLRTS